MNNLGLLIKYEWKKLLQKKMVWVSALVVVMVMVFSNLAFLMQSYSMNYTDDYGNIVEAGGESGYERMGSDKVNAKMLDGRAIDDALIKESLDALYSPDYTQWRRYDEINDLLWDVKPDYRRSGGMDEKTFYDAWLELVFSSMDSLYLTEGERAFWQKQVEKIETPFIYRYNLAWKNILGNQCLTIALLVVLLLSICLSGMFAEETRLKADQLVLCTKNGRNRTYYAKMIVGVIFGVFSALVLYGVSFGFNFFFYGIKGYGSVLQQIAAASPFPVSVGQAVLILFGLTLLAAVLESVFAMWLSLRLDNHVAGMAVIVGMMFLTLFVRLPEHFRVLSQIWGFFPTNLIAVGRFFDSRLVPFFGKYFTNFQFGVILYSACIVLFVWFGKRRYEM